MNGIFYLLHNGCPWRSLPHKFLAGEDPYIFETNII
ncbi:transposase [Trichocoleus sp. FACHB-69]|nr:transposase [Trichocoleus sp. FACHB-69]